MLRRVMMAGASAPPGTPFRWYRLYITANNGNSYTGLNELILRETPGGTQYPDPISNVITDPMTALTAASANSFYASNPPSGAFDQLYGGSDSWYNDADGLPCWIKYDLGSGNEKTVREFGIVMTGSEYSVSSRWPCDFVLQGSNDNLSWTDLKAVTGQVSWTSGTRLFSVP